MSSTSQSPPSHLKSPEIRRRLTMLVRTARELGVEIGGIRLAPDGEITLLDKSQPPANNDVETRWLGN